MATGGGLLLSRSHSHELCTPHLREWISSMSHNRPLPHTSPAAALLSSTFLGIGLLMAVLKAIAVLGGYRPSKWRTPTSEERVRYNEEDRRPLYAADASSEVSIRTAKAGVGALSPTTLPRLFRQAAALFPNRPALRVEAGGIHGGEWITHTWSEYYEECQRVAMSLIHLGFERHDHVNIIGFNSPRWFMAEMGCILAGGAAAGVYTTNESDSCRYIAAHSCARVVFVEDMVQLNKYIPFRAQLEHCIAFVVWNSEMKTDALHECAAPARKLDAKAFIYSWADFLALGGGSTAPELRAEVEARSASVQPGHCASLIYTSGTTGDPKAVMVSHDNMVWTAASTFSKVFSEGPAAGVLPPENFRVVSYLPLSHVAAQMLDMVTPIVVTGSGNGIGPEMLERQYYTTWFARPDALKGSLPKTLVAARPTVFLGVPRVWEKIKEAMQEVGRKNDPFKQALAFWAKRHALTAAWQRQLGGDGSRSAAYLVARSLILSKVKAALGLDQCLVCITGAAPMPRDVTEYFASLDIDVLDAYGLSETSGGGCFNSPLVHRLGTVGPPIPGTEVKVDHRPSRDKPGEGEICLRGRHVFMGYLKEPEMSADVIDSEGWFHSGDVGFLDDDGMLHITGRIKELLITAGGENIAPVPVEEKLRELCPALSNAVLIGDRCKYLICLFTAKTILDPETGLSTGRLAGDAISVSSAKTDFEAAAEAKIQGSAWQVHLQRAVDEYNRKFAISNAQRIKRFALLPEDFSERGGELTATLKLKRLVVADKYAATIDQLYSSM
eukprot:scaffold81222_cov28-Tisochrysis_lutea.AAC.1